jgi:LAS superfamily LD-carboxypeptidase LdcB
VRVTSVYRSYSEQLQLWLNRARNPYPVLPPGQSMHNLGRAFDVVGPDRVLEAAGAAWNSWGGRWSSSDPIHFEA